MKTSDLMKLVDALVEAKVNKLLPKLVTEEVKKQMKVLLSENSSANLSEELIQDMSSLLSDSIDLNMNSIKSKSAINKPVSKVYSKDSIINDILNKTANQMKNGTLDEKESFRSLMEKSIREDEGIRDRVTLSEGFDTNNDTLLFNSSHIGKIASHANLKNMHTDQKSSDEIKREVLKRELEMQANALGVKPQFDVLGLLARDYRQVLKASKEKDAKR